jgi:hypothetical protein
MLQLLYMDVASVCCKCFTYLRYLLQKCFMLQYINRCKKRANAEAVSTSATVSTCVASKVGVGAPHLHAHQQAWARSFTCTNMLGRACRYSRCMRHAGNMRGSSAAILHAGQALSSCGSGGQVWASGRLGASHAAQLLRRGDPCLPARTHPTKRPHPLLR